MPAANASLCPLLGLALLLTACALPNAAQKYPECNFRLITAFPTGASQILELLVPENPAPPWASRW